MFRIHPHSTIILLIVCAAFAGCRGDSSLSSQNQTLGTAPVVLAMTDTPPNNVSFLSAEVTLTGAILNPGNVSLISGSTVIELTRLQTDIAYVPTLLVPPGSYTSLTLMFSNPMLTIENDTGSSLATGGSNPVCSAGAICTIQSVATNLSATIALSPVTVSSTAGAGLLADVSLNSLLSATLGADFNNGVTVSQFTPAGSGAPPVGAEDVVGHVASTDTTHSMFSLLNARRTVSLTVDNTTTFLNFPAGSCTTPSILCVQMNQILSVDISIRADGTPVARNVLFEDANSSDIEVEGIVTSTGSLQFTIVTLAESDSTTITGLNIGAPTTVDYTVSTPFDKDLVYADNVQVSTIGYLFSSPADLIVGQQVLVRGHPAPSGASITADRVRLRSSRVSGMIQSAGSGFFQLGSIPSLFIPRGTAVIQVQISSPTICTGTVSSCSLLGVTRSVSVRGPLFANSGSPAITASKVLQR